MDIVNLNRLSEFGRRNPRAVAALSRWEGLVTKSLWKIFQDVKDTFNAVDYVQGKVVFNISGNNYRLIAVIDYLGKQVIVKEILSHLEYDKQNWKR